MHQRSSAHFSRHERFFADLECEARSSTCKFSSPAWVIFGGRQQSTTACAACGHYIVTHSWFSVLTLALPPQGSCTLGNLFKKYFSTEAISDSQCEANTCHGKDVVRKWTEVKIWPNTLVLHMVRWLAGGDKNNAKVTFEMEERVSLAKYKLMAVCVHTGSPHSGHYVSYTRCNSEWLLSDDSRVKVVTPHEVLNAEPYLLLYTKLA